MKVLLAPDKFKGSLHADEVCDSVASAIRNVTEGVHISCVPMADGGEGTCEVLTRANGGHSKECSVVDPLGRPFTTSYGLSASGKVAYVETAAASGLMVLDKTERNPLRTSTRGTGLMVRDAILTGAEEVVLGVGGSSTNDGGIGMATVFGYRFLDSEGAELQPSGAALLQIRSIDYIRPAWMADVAVTILCDVRNPLFGDQGAAHVFAPQKGADPAAVRLLDDGLRNLASIVEKQWGKNMNIEGGGAGGGIAAGAHVFLNGDLVPGVRYVIKQLNVEQRIRDSDLIISGEGALDLQSLSGKVVSGIAELCRRYEKPLVIFCGVNKLLPHEEKELGAAAIYPLVRAGVSGETAMANAAALLNAEVRKCFAEQIFRH